MRQGKPSRSGSKAWRWLHKIAIRTNDRRRKWTWRLSHGPSAETRPVFIVGAQRSGTSMLGQCLGRSPEIENMGETDPRAFTDFFLRDDRTIRDLVAATPYRLIVFKPLKDSHRVDELLAIDQRAKAVWAYRNYADRINSAVRHFGSHPLDVFQGFVRQGKIAWQLVGLADEDANLLHELDLDSLSLSDAAALMWYIRNALYFRQNLQSNERVLLWSYDRFVADPGENIRALTAFLDTGYDPFMISSVHSKSIGKNERPELDPKVEALCEAMFSKLEAAHTAATDP